MPHFSLPLMDSVTYCPDLGSRSASSLQQLRRAERHSLGVVLVFDPIPTAFLPDMLTQQLPGPGMHNPHVECIPLHFDEPSDPARWQSVIGCLDFDATVQMHSALSVLVVVEGFEWRGQQGRFFFGEDGCDLSFRRALDPRVRPALFPVIQVSLGLFQAFKAQSF